MARISQIIVIAAMLLVIPLPCEAEEFALKAKKIKLNKTNVAVLPEIELRPSGSTPDGLSKEPKYKSRRHRLFATRFGGAEGIDVVFAVDEKQGAGEGFDYLYVDVVGTGNLAKGKKLNGKVAPRGYSYLDTRFPPCEIEIPALGGAPGDGRASGFPVQARFSHERGSVEGCSLYLMPLCVLTGTVKLGDASKTMIVFDADCNGVFGEAGSPSGHVARGDKIWIGKGSPKAEAAYVEALPIGKYLFFGGEYWELSFAGGNDAKTVSVKKADVPLGTVAVDNPGFILELVEDGSVLYVGGEGQRQIPVPAGSYTINTVGFRQKHRGKLWELEGKTGSCRERLTVTEGAETSIDLGPPLKIMVTTTQRPEGSLLRVSMSFSIEGIGGEVYSYLKRNGEKIDLPHISVRNKRNKEVHKGHFEYG